MYERRMRAPRGTAALRALREQPLWKLLAADTAPVIVALLQDLLLDGEQVLGASVLTERLGHALEELRIHGEDLPQTATAYVAEWLRQGWLTRRLPDGASEEQIALSSEAAHAIRFISSLRERRVVATESRAPPSVRTRGPVRGQQTKGWPRNARRDRLGGRACARR